MIIPQLLFSGVIVKFDKLHPSLSNATKVPWVGNMMASRWAYESLAVEQASQNSYELYFLANEIEKAKAEWRKDYWIPELKKNIDLIIEPTTNPALKENALKLLQNEIAKADKYWKNIDCVDCEEDLSYGVNLKTEDFRKVDSFLFLIRKHSNGVINKERQNIQNIIKDIGIVKYKELQSNYSNDALTQIATNKTETNKFIIDNFEIFQNDNPIYNDPKGVPFFDTHYYAPYKYIFGYKFKTYTANLITLWAISLITYIALYFDILKKVIMLFQQIWDRLRRKKAPIE